MVSALRAGRQAAIERVSRPRRAHLVGVGVVTAIIAAIYSVYSLTLYYTFKTSAYDLTIFDQAVRSYAHFHLGISPLKGVHNGFGPNFSVLGDHFSPIIAVLAPLYWIHNSPSTLLVAQAVLLALAIPSLWLFTRRAFGGGRKATAAAYLVAVAYGLSWPLIAAVAFDFHEAAFAPVLTAVVIERFQAGRLRTALIALVGLLLVKEDMGLFVAGLGVWLVLSRERMVPRQFLVALGMIVVGVIWTAGATYLLIPAFGGRGDYYWAYGNLGKNVPGVIKHLVVHPRSSFLTIFEPARKLKTIRDLLAPFLFLPLLSPIVVAIIPLILERMLGNAFPNWWGITFQYNSYLVVALVCAGVDGAARLDRWASRAWALSAARFQGVPAGARPAAPAAAATAAPGAAGAASAPAPAATPGEEAADGDQAGGGAGAPAGPDAPAGAGAGPPARAPWISGKLSLACAAAMVVAAVAVIPFTPLKLAFHAGFYQRNAQQNAAAAADARVPSGVSVQATQFLAPQLAERDYVLLWDGDGRHPPLLPQYVVASLTQRQFTFCNLTAQFDSVRQYEHEGYTVIFRRSGYLVLRRPAKYDGRPAVPTPAVAPPPACPKETTP
jgi:uncharacterized membrane protein